MKRGPKPGPIPLKYRMAYKSHRGNARKRNIAFLISREEWLVWWEDNLGPDWFQKRGRLKGMHVMARNGDKGPYKLGNVECILADQNCRDCKKNKANAFGERHAKAKLTEIQVKEIYLAAKRTNGNYKGIGERFNVSSGTVEGIRNKRTWAYLTDTLDRPSSS